MTARSASCCRWRRARRTWAAGSPPICGSTTRASRGATRSSIERPGGSRILDDRSANGTFVNGRRVTEAELADGDVVVLGRVVLTYRDVP